MKLPFSRKRPGKHMLVKRFNPLSGLRQMLEWRMEIDHDWSMPAGALGKGLKNHLSPEIWTQLERTYVGADIEDNWEALIHAMALFRQVAMEVGKSLS